ncbi:MAG TPA: uracil-DNA glycosylase [Clostridiales bacterium]|nr:uracil-DNA glycosylase [Clostridiales bacterium]
MLELEELKNQCLQCEKCRLHSTRKNVVFGEGNAQADIMFVGEAPGGEEDATGIPFIGKAGQLLNLALKSLRIRREECYIGNICKCRPENNRIPYEDEALTCITYLKQQVEIIKPKVIVCLGATPLKYIVDKDAQITKSRGQWIEKGEFIIMPTFHPAALLRDESKKLPFWEDLRKVRDQNITRYDS